MKKCSGDMEWETASLLLTSSPITFTILSSTAEIVTYSPFQLLKIIDVAWSPNRQFTEKEQTMQTELTNQ